ncbi:MAG: hypothetical protein ACHQ49_17485, partial [Elusimicrobiota bacterium]
MAAWHWKTVVLALTVASIGAFPGPSSAQQSAEAARGVSALPSVVAGLSAAGSANVSAAPLPPVPSGLAAATPLALSAAAAPAPAAAAPATPELEPAANAVRPAAAHGALERTPLDEIRKMDPERRE